MDFDKIKGLLETNDSIEIDDNDLEDELNAIISGASSKPSSRKPQTTTTTSSSSSSSSRNVRSNDRKSKDNKLPNKKQNTNQNEFDLLNIEKLGIIGDFEEDDNDEDIDEDNEDLLAEISNIASGPSPAKKVSKQNVPVIPPVDYMSEAQPPNTSVSNNSQAVRNTYATHIPSSTSIRESPKHDLVDKPSTTQISQAILKDIKQTEKQNEISRLNDLRDQYKRAALMAKKSGDQSTALSHIKTAKQIEILTKALEDGQSVDLSQLPPPPSTSLPNVAQNNIQSSSQTPAMPKTSAEQEPGGEIEIPNVELNEEEAKKLFNAPPPPTTVMEALEQRLAKFKSTLEQAKEEDNAGKVRRLGRIVKQYENAIKDVKKGKQVDFEELPTPPGFGPIPTESSSKQENTAKQPVSAPTNQPSSQPAKPISKPKPAESAATNVNKSPQTGGQVQKQAIEPSPPKPTQRPNLKRASSTASKQLNYLLERQRLFKEAALQSKQKGDIQQAKEYLRMAKGFDPLIEATQNGLPIDATSIPTPPQMTDDFVVVSHPESSDVDNLEREEIYRKIEIELQSQIEMCKRNKEHFLLLGDVSTASKFEKYAVESKKDMDMLFARWRNGERVPTFRYEMRTFSMVICNTEVGTNEVSVEVIKAIDIPGKNDIDTYIKVEFPFPNDQTQSGRTKTVKNSINPVFNETFKFNIDRKSRQLPRVFKRHPLKLELFSKGGFLRSDSLIGTVLIKLTDFETKCTIHDSFPLTEGRKIVGGKIEARVRIREPLLAKQVEEVKEKWLIFT